MFLNSDETLCLYDAICKKINNDLRESGETTEIAKILKDKLSGELKK